MSKLLKNNWSLKGGLILFFVFFALTISLSYFWTNSSFVSFKEYQSIIDIAGRNREIIEQVVIYANQITDTRPGLSGTFDKQLAKDQLITDKGLFELNLRLLKGEKVDASKKIKIPDPNPEILPLLTEIDNEWYQSYEKSIQTIFVEDIIIGVDSITNLPLLNPKVEQATLVINRDNKKMLAQHNELIRKYQSVFQKQIDRANNWLLVLWIINVIFILLGLFLILDWLFKPLNQISRVAQSIGEGDLRRKIDYNYKNEVGIVAMAINGMIDKIQNATNFIKSIEKGDLTISYHGLNGSSLEKDTLAGALINMREKMKAVALDEEERTWTTKGLAMFGEILQKYNDDTERLSYEIISNVVRYQDANQGGLFILKDEDATPKRLELIASYAFNRRKYIKKEVVEGEGLVGQSFKDADTIYITDIPENYVDITSGLGGTRPKSVLVVPLKMSDQVYGVIELASFDEFKPYEIAFLEKLSENIASNLYAARANERTKKLLVESNHITSQMKQQEQEMRNNLRMLEETQIEMQKNQEALAAQSYAIKSTLITVELGMDRSILSANELFLKATNYKASELIGKSHEVLVPGNQIDQSYYDRLWRDLRVGIPHSGEYKRLSKDGKEIWLKATYSPITNKDGVPYKILKLAFDVTEDKRLRLDFKEQLDSFKRSSAVVEFDLEGKIIDVNDNFLDLMEYERDEIIGQDHLVIVPDDEKKSKSYRALWHKLRQGTYHIGEVKRVTKTGKTVWFQGSFNPILDLNGKPYKIIEFIIDITARKSAENRILATKEELQFKEANLTALLNNTDDVIYTIGPNYRITLMNDSAKRFFEKMGESLRISSNVLDIIPRNYYYIWKGYYDRALGGEKFSVEQAIFSEKTNHKFYLSIFFNPILDEFGKISGVAIFSRNITKRKQRELDISEFTKKQASRTARIIENQKQALQLATDDFEKERQKLNEALAQEKSEKLELEKELDYHLQIDAPLIVFNHDYELLRMNKEAQELFRQWHIYLQPGYFLPDCFPEYIFKDYKTLFDKALEGETFNSVRIIHNHYARDYKVLSLHFKPVQNDRYEVIHVVLSAWEITDFVRKKREKQLKSRKRLLNKSRFEAKRVVREVQEEMKSLEARLHVESHKKTVQDELLDMINHNIEDVLFKIDQEFLVKSYNHKAREIFMLWHIYIQPDYFIPDVFPIAKYEEWFSWLEQGLAGEAHYKEEIFVNRYYRKILAFGINFRPIRNEEGEVTHLTVKAKDITPEWQAQRLRKGTVGDNGQIHKRT